MNIGTLINCAFALAISTLAGCSGPVVPMIDDPMKAHCQNNHNNSRPTNRLELLANRLARPC